MKWRYETAAPAAVICLHVRDRWETSAVSRAETAGRQLRMAFRQAECNSGTNMNFTVINVAFVSVQDAWTSSV